MHAKKPSGNKSPALGRALALVMALVMALSAFNAGQITVRALDPPPPGIITNYPFNPDAPTGPADGPWTQKVDHPGYDTAYTQDRSQTYNGAATPDHVVLNNRDVSFYGYYSQPYMDYVFTDEYSDVYGAAFIMRPLIMNFHSFSESAFVFNGELNDIGGQKYYTGYAVSLQCGNVAGMQESNPSAPNTASLRLYYITNELWNTSAFRPGQIGVTRTHIATLKSGIGNQDPTPYRFSVEIDPATRAFKLYLDGALCYTETAPVGGGGGPTGVGFYTGFYSHSCSILSIIRYEDVVIEVVVPPPTQTTAEVQLLDYGTGAPLCDPAIEIGYAPYQKYKITAPGTLMVGGKVYKLVDSSLGIDLKILRTGYDMRYRPAPADNVTRLYYYTKTAGSVDLKEPEKTARVNGQAWNPGTPQAPVAVNVGDEIEYSVMAYGKTPTPAKVPMLRQGNFNGNADTTWWNQPGTAPNVQKQQILSSTFVNVKNVDLAAILSGATATWEGKPILKKWDATEANTTINPGWADYRVIVWVTASGGNYDLYVGGEGGVWLSASSGDSAQFFSFTAMTRVFNMANMHAELATNLCALFSGCSVLREQVYLLDTSSATIMAEMFHNCFALTIADLTGFNTSSATSMRSMFMGCSSLTLVDVFDFNTSNVTDMSYMFSGCRALDDLDLSTWSFAGIAAGGSGALQSMFLNCDRLALIHMENVELAHVSHLGNASNMFGMNAPTVTTVSAGSAAMQSWFNSQQPFRPRNTIIGVPPTLPPQFATVVDTIPAGLTITSITGTSSATPIPGQITWVRSGQTITWTIPDSLLPADLRVKATVDASATSKSFDNQATAQLPGSDPMYTDWTYHELTVGWNVQEEYYLLDAGVTTALAAPVVTNVADGGSYDVVGNTGSMSGYRYFGYRRVGIEGSAIGDIVQAQPPSPAYDSATHSADFATTGRETIQLYYVPNVVVNKRVTIHYVDQTGTALKAPQTQQIAMGQDFYMPARHFDTFTVGTSDWTYYDYAKNADNSVRDVMPAGASPHPIPGGMPVFPNRAAPDFQNVIDDMNIVLYFTTDGAVTVNFVQKGRDDRILHNPVTFFAGYWPFDVGAQNRSAGVPLTDDIPVTSVGKLFGYTGEYKVDTGAVVTAALPDVTESCEVTLYFDTPYIVTERFLLDNGSHLDTTLYPDRVHGGLPGGYAFHANNTPAPAWQPPAAVGPYEYLGYVVDAGPLVAGTPAALPAPVVSPVYDDRIVDYVYEDTGTTYTVTYAPGAQGTFPSQVTTDLPYGDPTPAAPASTPGNPGWRFTGWSPTPAATVTDDATYVAQWERILYTVRYEPGAQGTFTAQVTTGLFYNDATPAAPATPGNPGWRFTGWLPAPAATVTADATYVAQWERIQYTVRYEPGAQGTFTAQVTTGLFYNDATPAAPATPGNPGWRFTGWLPAPAATVTADATYVAQWEQILYTVTYDPGAHGTFPAQVTGGLTYGVATPSAPASTPGDAGWRFIGWAPIPAATVTDDATYVAQWAEDLPTFTVIYAPGTQGTFPAVTHANQDSGDPTPAAPAATPGNPGWRFTGWSPVPTPTVTGDAVYVAQWERLTYTVIYQPGAHGTFAAVTHSGLFYGTATPAAPATPGETGWQFDGWLPARAATVTGDATYVAQWKQEKQEKSGGTTIIPIPLVLPISGVAPILLPLKGLVELIPGLCKTAPKQSECCKDCAAPPKTGEDNNAAAAWAMLFGLAAMAGLAGLFVTRKRRRYGHGA